MRLGGEVDDRVAAGHRSGDKVWRLPSDPEYDEALRGQYARA